MPAPRSRRSARASQNQAQPEVEDIDVVDTSDEYDAQTLESEHQQADYDSANDEGIDVDEAPSSGRSSRRGKAKSSATASRSSKRMSASERRNSGRNSLKSSRRVAVSPEELARRRAAQMLVVKLLLGVIIGFAAVGALYWFVLRIDPRVDRAKQSLAHANSLINSADTAIGVKEARRAESLRVEAIATLEIAELGFAKPSPNPEDPELASLILAQKAVELRDKLDGALKTRIERVERDLAVQSNKMKIKTGLGRLGGANGFTDAELATFERNVHDFLVNPVLPGAGANETYQNDYDGDIKEIKFEVLKIDQEKTRRESSITDLPVREARSKAALLVRTEKFQEALAVVDDMQRDFQTANFAPVRQYIRDAARLAWESTSSAAKEHYTTYLAVGTTEAGRQAALQASQQLLQSVVDNYGIPEYVDQAKALLSSYR